MPPILTYTGDNNLTGGTTGKTYVGNTDPLMQNTVNQGTYTGPNVIPVSTQGYNSNQGVVDLSNGQIIKLYPIPTSFTITSSSNNGAGAVTITQNLFNNSVLNPAITTNGSGANSVTTIYGDGFSGRVYDQYLTSANSGQGLLFKGFTLQVTNFTSGSQISTAFNTMALNLITSNGQGSTIPMPTDMAEAIRATNFQNGTLSIMRPFYFNSLQQWIFQQPPNTVFAFTMFTQASSAM